MLNRFTGVGRLTKDPVLQKTSNGISTIKFSVAVERDRKNSTGSYPTDFILCQAWRSSAEFLSRYTKWGRKVADQKKKSMVLKIKNLSGSGYRCSVSAVQKH